MFTAHKVFNNVPITRPKSLVRSKTEGRVKNLLRTTVSIAMRIVTQRKIFGGGNSQVTS